MARRRTFKNIPFEFQTASILKSDDEKWIVEGYASTDTLDRQDEIITKDALIKAEKDLLENNTVFYEHKHSELPIGKVIGSEVDQKGLKIKVQISKTASTIWQLVQEGVLHCFSIGGRIIKAVEKYLKEQDKKIIEIQEIELLEVSLVGIPANPEARAINWYISKALFGGEEKMEKVEEKKVEVPEEKALTSSDIPGLPKEEEKVEEKVEEKKIEELEKKEEVVEKNEEPKEEEEKPKEEEKKEEVCPECGEVLVDGKCPKCEKKEPEEKKPEEEEKKEDYYYYYYEDYGKEKVKKPKYYYYYYEKDGKRVRGSRPYYEKEEKAEKPKYYYYYYEKDGKKVRGSRPYYEKYEEKKEPCEYEEDEKYPKKELEELTSLVVKLTEQLTAVQQMIKDLDTKIVVKEIEKTETVIEKKEEPVIEKKEEITEKIVEKEVEKKEVEKKLEPEVKIETKVEPETKAIVVPSPYEVEEKKTVKTTDEGWKKFIWKR